MRRVVHHSPLAYNRVAARVVGAEPRGNTRGGPGSTFPATSSHRPIPAFRTVHSGEALGVPPLPRVLPAPSSGKRSHAATPVPRRGDPIGFDGNPDALHRSPHNASAGPHGGRAGHRAADGRSPAAPTRLNWLLVPVVMTLTVQLPPPLTPPPPGSSYIRLTTTRASRHSCSAWNPKIYHCSSR